MCQHIEPKKNRWYYRRRIPVDCRDLHRDVATGKKPQQIYFSLKTSSKTEACKLAVSHTRRLDAMWTAPSPQTLMTCDILMTGKVPKTLSNARNKHIELGKLSTEPKKSSNLNGLGTFSSA